MVKIDKKTWPEHFEKILNGKKKFDLRLDDFKCNIGDIIVLKEFNPKTKKYTGRVIEKEVTYVLKTKDISFWTEKEIKENGLQILSLK